MATTPRTVGTVTTQPRATSASVTANARTDHGPDGRRREARRRRPPRPSRLRLLRSGVAPAAGFPVSTPGGTGTVASRTVFTAPSVTPRTTAGLSWADQAQRGPLGIRHRVCRRFRRRLERSRWCRAQPGQRQGQVHFSARRLGPGALRGMAAPSPTRHLGCPRARSGTGMRTAEAPERRRPSAASCVVGLTAGRVVQYVVGISDRCEAVGGCIRVGVGAVVTKEPPGTPWCSHRRSRPTRRPR